MTTDSASLVQAFDARVRRREERRDFFRTALGGAAVAAAGAAAIGLASEAQAQTVTEPDILNFALNLEYLEAQFYSFATTGAGLTTTLSGTGTQGAATGGRAVPFSDLQVARYAREIAADEAAHVQFLRTQLGNSAVAQPAIDLSPGGAFTAAARAATVVDANTVFDPYASDENFLLAAFLFEDVGVTAYRGAAPLLTTKTYLDAAAGILSAEAYHAAIIRSTLYQKGIRAKADLLSNARDTLDGGQDLDQGISPTAGVTDPSAAATTTTYTRANVTPADLNGLAYSRSAGQVLGIVYLNATAGTTAGGFFPAGINGTIKSSSAS